MNYTPVLDYQIVFYRKHDDGHSLSNTFVTDGTDELKYMWDYCAEEGVDLIKIYNATGGGLEDRHLVAEFPVNDPDDEARVAFVEKLEKAIMEYEGALK